ncbi:MAG: NAD(P)-dependent oxidoreductase [Lachnospiraceae bacterium]|nr:NAD(P)-dependent oxidoreductase [Lachnospiraceae bacterium]
MNHVIVTGGGGFIGTYVCKRLHEKGCSLIVIDRVAVEAPYVYKSIVTDIGNDACVEQICRELTGDTVSAVIHLAADIRMNETESLIRTNCLGTLHITEVAARLQAERFVYLSSAPVIGEPVKRPVDEEHPVNPLTLYHVTKYAGEMIVKDLDAKGIRTSVLRICSPIGVREKQTAYLGFLLDKCRMDQDIQVYGTGSRVQNYIDVRDVANAVCLALKGQGLYLIRGGSSISNLELAKLCVYLTGSSSKVVTGTKPDPDDHVQWILDGGRAERELGYVPAYSVEDTIRWILGEEQ